MEYGIDMIEWNGIESMNGMEWNRIEWNESSNGIEWNEWNGME